jgi:UDP-3-O-[3-hydroxymyristoyl] glucosamine N-acyltransferase
MDQHSFFAQPQSLTLAEIVALTGATLVDPAAGERRIKGLAVLGQAGPSQLTFFENQRYAAELEHCHAAACFVSARLERHLPSRIVALRVAHPYLAFVTVARKMHPDSLRPLSMFGASEIAPSAVVHPTARLEDGVTVDPLAVIGPNAEIGQDTVIGPGAVIGPNVKLGRSCTIGAHTTIVCSLIGNNVIIHPGCQIGQDGYGFVPGPQGLMKVPQTGRVIIQNDVEIGANTTIDRGALRDTVIGEGTKIDNLVQIAHNVSIGRHCIVVSQVGLSGSTTIGDGVALGARVGTNNHVVIGDGAQVAATSIVNDDLPAGGKYGGTPAKPVRLWFREMAVLERLARRGAAVAEPSANPSRQKPEAGTDE